MSKNLLFISILGLAVALAVWAISFLFSKNFWLSVKDNVFGYISKYVSKFIIVLIAIGLFVLFIYFNR